MYNGRLFQAAGPAKAKPRSPSLSQVLKSRMAVISSLVTVTRLSLVLFTQPSFPVISGHSLDHVSRKTEPLRLDAFLLLADSINNDR